MASFLFLFPSARRSDFLLKARPFTVADYSDSIVSSNGAGRHCGKKYSNIQAHHCRGFSTKLTQRILEATSATTFIPLNNGRLHEAPSTRVILVAYFISDFNLSCFLCSF